MPFGYIFYTTPSLGFLGIKIPALEGCYEDQMRTCTAKCPEDLLADSGSQYTARCYREAVGHVDFRARQAWHRILPLPIASPMTWSRWSR